MADLKIIAWIPDMVLKPVKTNMNAKPRKKMLKFFTVEVSIM